MRRTLVAGLAGASVVLAACGTADTTGAGSDAAAAITLPVPAAGPPPSLPVSPASADNPLPDLAVRRINGDGGWVQFKDLLPSDKPTLFWFWAPH